MPGALVDSRQHICLTYMVETIQYNIYMYMGHPTSRFSETPSGVPEPPLPKAPSGTRVPEPPLPKAPPWDSFNASKGNQKRQANKWIGGICQSLLGVNCCSLSCDLLVPAWLVPHGPEKKVNMVIDPCDHTCYVIPGVGISSEEPTDEEEKKKAKPISLSLKILTVDHKKITHAVEHPERLALWRPKLAEDQRANQMTHNAFCVFYSLLSSLAGFQCFFRFCCGHSQLSIAAGIPQLSGAELHGPGPSPGGAGTPAAPRLLTLHLGGEGAGLSGFFAHGHSARSGQVWASRMTSAIVAEVISALGGERSALLGPHPLRRPPRAGA